MTAKFKGSGLTQMQLEASYSIVRNRVSGTSHRFFKILMILEHAMLTFRAFLPTPVPSS